MPLISSTVIAPSNTKTEIQSPADYSPLLLLPVVAKVGCHYSKKQMRKAKRNMVWQLMKMKLQSMFFFLKKEWEKNVKTGNNRFDMSYAGRYRCFNWGNCLGLNIILISICFAALLLAMGM